jgi:hypothetical protein
MQGAGSMRAFNAALHAWRVPAAVLLATVIGWADPSLAQPRATAKAFFDIFKELVEIKYGLRHWQYARRQSSAFSRRLCLVFLLLLLLLLLLRRRRQVRRHCRRMLGIAVHRPCLFPRHHRRCRLGKFSMASSINFSYLSR